MKTNVIIPTDTIEKIKSILDFGSKDIENLIALQPIVEKHGDRITEAFYDRLNSLPDTARFLEGRLESLKAKHNAWMRTLVAGEYGEAYLQRRWKIGLVHVHVGLDPYWVESVMSYIRTSMGKAMATEISDPAELAEKHSSFVKVCDIDLAIMNLSYAEERLERIVAFTGMKRELIENIIRLSNRSAS